MQMFKGVKAGSVYALNEGCALNNGVRLTTRVYGIPHDERVNACEEFLNTRTDQSPPTKNLCQLTQLILENNAFIFNGAYYLQLQGTAMATRKAPSYANLFMGKFEQQFLWTQNKLPLVWWRYIDGVFTIWTQGPMLERVLTGVEQLPHDN